MPDDGVIEFEVGGLIAKIDPVDGSVLSRRWKLKRSGNHVCLVRNLTLSNPRRYKGLYLHRMIVGPIPKGLVIDHINGDALDNRRSNLRVVTHQENLRNVVAREGKNCPYIGVKKSRNRFSASITVDGRYHHLGNFGTAEEAYEARCLAEVEAWGVQPRRASDIALAASGEMVSVRTDPLSVSHASQFPGVWKKGNKWRACMSVNNKTVHLGSFDTEAEAAAAALAARKERKNA